MYADLLKKIFVPRQMVLYYYKKYGFSPDSFKKRICWECKDELDFWEFCSQFKDGELEHVIALWQNERIEFYCCKCFKQRESEKEQIIK